MARAGGGGIFAWLFFKDVSIISLVSRFMYLVSLGLDLHPMCE